MASETQGELRALLPARLVVPWAVLLAGVLVVELGLGVQGADYPTPFAIAHAYRMVVGAELFFLLVAVPLLSSGGSDRAQPGFVDLALLLCLGAPAVVVAAWVSDGSLSQVIASQGYLAASALLVAGLLRAAARREAVGWYWLGLGALGGGAPVVAFIAEDLLRARVGWLYAASPFWVADRLCRPWAFDWTWAVPVLVILLLAAAFALPWGRRRLTAQGRQLY